MEKKAVFWLNVLLKTFHYLPMKHFFVVGGWF
jgi:hypothetical protein